MGWTCHLGWLFYTPKLCPKLKTMHTLVFIALHGVWQLGGWFLPAVEAMEVYLPPTPLITSSIFSAVNSKFTFFFRIFQWAAQLASFPASKQDHLHHVPDTSDHLLPDHPKLHLYPHLFSHNSCALLFLSLDNHRPHFGNHIGLRGNALAKYWETVDEVYHGKFEANQKTGGRPQDWRIELGNHLKCLYPGVWLIRPLMFNLST